MLTRGPLLVVAVGLVAGCSLVMEPVRPGWRRSQDPACTRSRVAPVVDATTATLLGAGGVGLMTQCEGDSCHEPVFGLLLIGVALPYLLSATLGFVRAHQCRCADRVHEAWLADVRRRERERDAVSPVPEGARAGRCFPNRTCHQGLVCVAGRCVVGPEDGASGGRCYRNQTCDVGLECSAGRCRPMPVMAPP